MNRELLGRRPDGQSVAALLPTPSDDLPARTRPHPHEKTVRTPTPLVVWLIRPLDHDHFLPEQGR